MLKYVNMDVVFQEIPDEVTLAINISNCPCHCPGCHSKFLWGDTGAVLDNSEIDVMLSDYVRSITCICFMGGDAEPESVDALAAYIRKAYPQLKTGWYTGRTVISSRIALENFDYIKVGPYIEHLGGLKNPETNQRFYRINHTDRTMEDMTSRFWKK